MSLQNNLNKLVNKERICVLLKERNFDYEIMVNKNNEDDWIVQFVSDRQIPGESIFHFITPTTKVNDLWWLT